MAVDRTYPQFTLIKDIFRFWIQLGLVPTTVILTLIIFAALAELLGLASLLPVANALFQGGPLHLGIAASVLGFVGVHQPGMWEFLVLVMIMMLARGAALLASYRWLASLSTKFEAKSTISLIHGITGARWVHLSRFGLGRLVDSVTRLPSEAGVAGTAGAAFTAAIILALTFISTVAYVSIPTLSVAFIVAIPLAVCLRYTSASTQAAYARLSPAQAAKGKQAVELVQNAKFFKVGGAYRLGLAEFDSAVEQARKANLQAANCSALIQTVPDTVVAIGIATLIAIVYGFKLDGGSNFILSLMLMYRAFHYTNQTLASAQTLSRYLPSFGVLSATLADLSEQQELNSVGGKSIKFSDTIELRQIGFSYTSDAPVLVSANLLIQRGDIVVLQGESGAGKTTIIDILLGLLEPQSGGVYIDGIRLDRDTLESWREKIVYIPQEPPMFAGTVRSNLAMTASGELALSDENLYAALKVAQLDTVIRERKEGLETPIGDRGIALSGGQRQRLLVARALLTDAEVIVLDEPTSAVDPQKEALIFEEIFRQIRGKKTLIMAVHRMVVPRDVGRTLRVHQGQIVEG